VIWRLLDKLSREKMFSKAELDTENIAHAEVLPAITRLHNQPYVSSSLEVSEGLMLDMNPAHSDGWPPREDHISLHSTFVYVDIAILGVTCWRARVSNLLHLKWRWTRIVSFSKSALGKPGVRVGRKRPISHRRKDSPTSYLSKLIYSQHARSTLEDPQCRRELAR
jgi:hypothetical protein